MKTSLRHQRDRFDLDVQRTEDGFAVQLEEQVRAVWAQVLPDGSLGLEINGVRHRADVVLAGNEIHVSIGGESYCFTRERAAGRGDSHAAGVASPEITAPMPGKIVEVKVAAGDVVKSGDVLLILEAMKMETRLTAEADGTVEHVHVVAGEMVEGGRVLATVRYAEE